MLETTAFISELNVALSLTLYISTINIVEYF